jgi:hypothetical protein
VNKPVNLSNIDIRQDLCPWLSAILALLHISALFLCLYIEAPVAVKSVFTLVVLVSGWWNWRTHHIKAGAQAVREVSWSPSGGWVVTDGNNTCEAVNLLASSIRSPVLLVLRLSNGRGRVRTAIISPRCGTDPETLRRCRLAMQAGGEDA